MRPEQALDLLEYEQAMNEVHSQVEHKRRGGRGGERETEGLGWNAGARRGAGEGLTKEEAADEKMTVAYDAIARAACDRRVAEQAARKEAIRNGDTGAGGRRAAACRRSRAATRRDAPRPTWRRLKPRRRARRSSKRRRARWRAAQRSAPTCPAREAARQTALRSVSSASCGQGARGRLGRTTRAVADHVRTFQGRVWGVCACLPYGFIRLYV